MVSGTALPENNKLKGRFMKTKSELFGEIESYVKSYIQPKRPKDFIPVVYAVSPEKETAEQFKEMLGVVELIEKTNSSVIGRVFIGANLPHKTSVAFFAKNGELNKGRDTISKMCREFGLGESPQLICGVILLPTQFQKQEVLLTDVPFKEVFERAG